MRLRRVPNALINDHGVFIGEIAHIHAASDRGPRAVKGMSDEERRAEANLILLCRNHHRTIDARPDDFSAQMLRDLKGSHEAVFARGTEQLFATGVEDITKSTGWVPAETLAALPDNFDDLTDDEMAVTLEIANGLPRRLARISKPARQLLAQAIIRGNPTGGWRREEVRADAEVVRRTTGRGDVPLSKSELLDLVALLDEQGLGWLEEEELDRAQILVGGSTGDDGWHLLAEIWTLAASGTADQRPDPDLVHRIIVDIDFSALDE